MEKQYFITMTESDMKRVIAILKAVNNNRKFQIGSNLRESYVCNIDQRDIETMKFVTDKKNWEESDEPFYVEVGKEVEIDGRIYVCKKYIEDPDAYNECEECAFNKAKICPNLACSDSDRKDGQSVLFVEKQV